MESANGGVNGSVAYKIAKGGRYQIEAIDDNMFTRYQNERAENSKDFNMSLCTFWVKHNVHKGNKIKVIIEFNRTVTPNPRQRKYSYDLDPTATNAWQYVEKEFYQYEEYWNSVEFYFESDQDDAEIVISGLQMTERRQGEGVALDAIGAVGDSEVFLNHASKFLVTTNSGMTEFNNDENFFFTLNDISETFLSMHKGSPFVLTYNNGTKKIAGVTNVTAQYSSDIYAKEKISFAIDNNQANFFLKQMTTNSVNYHTRYFYYEDYCKTVTHKIIDHADKSQTETWVDYHGKTIKTIDSYGVRKNYYYDTYGNLDKTTVGDEKSGIPEIVAENYYNVDEDEDKEVLSGASVNDIRYHYEFNPLSAVLMTQKIGNGATMQVTYDAFDERVKKVEFYGDFSQYALANTVIYNSRGCVSQLSNGQMRMDITYNKLNEVSQYAINGNTIKTKQKNGLTVREDYTGNQGDPTATSTSFNKYGQITFLDKIEDRQLNGRVRCVYQQHGEKLNEGREDAPCNRYFIESLSVAKIKTIYSTEENAQYSFNYDNDNQPCGYKVSPITDSASGMKAVEVRQLTATKTRYQFDGDTYETEILEDADQITRRITKTVNSKTEGLFSYKYSYDDYGRVYKQEYESQNSHYEFSKEINYRVGTDLVSSIDYYFNNKPFKLNSNICFGYDCDERGNITQISSRYKAINNDSNNILFPDEDKEYVEEFQYDSLNRITSEKTYEKNCRYVYDGYGNLAKIYDCSAKDESGNDRLVEERTYTLGNLTKRITYTYIADRVMRTEVNYGYDNFGNVRVINQPSLQDKVIEWKYGNRLEKYGDTEFKYNYQGVRYYKKTGSKQVDYFIDGNKILGENVTDGGKKYRIRYFYDATGICGFKLIGDWTREEEVDSIFTYLKDSQGTVRGIFGQGRILTIYAYDSAGRPSIIKDSYDAESGLYVGKVNPIRWKSAYYDEETALYYINQRYYSPILMTMIGAKQPEEVTEGIGAAYGLDPLNFCGYNGVGFLNNEATIEREEELYADPTYLEWDELSWWDKYRFVVIIGIFIAALAVTAVAATISPVAAAAMLKAGLKAGITSIAFTVVEQAIVSAITGQNFFAVISEQIVQSFMLSFAIAAIMEGMIAGIKAIRQIRSANKAFTASPTNGDASTQSCAAKCFIEGTLVRTKEGNKAIEDIKVGDLVLAYDEKTGKKTYKLVLRLFRNKSKEWTSVTVNGTEIVSTPGHKYYLPETKEWVSAAELKVGTKVLLSDGAYGIIEAVR
ncbi:MAG: hypothetical protein K2N06_05260, partial [Oscillospiraceae bacterium]|nr:hypothetical protein [Oscillospiraceae bacterium]